MKDHEYTLKKVDRADDEFREVYSPRKGHAPEPLPQKPEALPHPKPREQMKIVKWLLDRLKEASSWLSVAFLVTLGLPEELAPTVIEAITAIAAIIAFILKDKAPSETQTEQ